MRTNGSVVRTNYMHAKFLCKTLTPSNDGEGHRGIKGYSDKFLAGCCCILVGTHFVSFKLLIWEEGLVCLRC